MKRLFIIAMVSLSVLYMCDYFLIRYRIQNNHDPFGVVQVERYYTVPQKNGSTEFFYGEPEKEACVHSLFPHFGDNPCWYANRRKEKRIDL